ncbi:MAG TPA: LLM class flavin-dependent oxidoreductase [Anaerolineales bacterium]|nr:LLM class flavin-dependent oxidoreductase [Anaerolineales bacterium]
MEISLNIEGASGLTWPRWKRFVDEFEPMGFDGVFASDHFTWPNPPDLNSLELFVALAYLADHSQRIHFGSLVSPFSFRDPVFLARQAVAIDELSQGRMILGVGAGWQEREHNKFGYDLGDMKTRMDRLEEGLHVVTQLIRSQEPVSFSGKFFRLEEAQLLPRPERPTRILVGSKGPKRSLPMVARYADIWNCSIQSPEIYVERSALLDELLRAEGRKPADVKRTLMLTAICWRDEGEKERRMALLRRGLPSFADLSTEDLIASLRENPSTVLGLPEVVVEHLQLYEAAGVEEIMLQWFSMDDIEGLETLAEYVRPHFR